MTLRAADSWLVEDGRVRGWDLHWGRFASAAGVDVSALEAEVRRELPRTGSWFPRVECDERGELSWRLRPAPARESFVVCSADPIADPRTSPRVKGPDLETLVELRGDGEQLLADAGGSLLEGCLSSLLWWDGGVLCVVDDELPILDGITRRLLLGIATAQCVEVDRRRPHIEDLHGREVWLTSALHGIRAISEWSPAGPAAGAPERRDEWQGSLEALALELDR